MIYAKDIDIRGYSSNIEVFADFGENHEENNGRILHIETTGDTYPDESYEETPDDIKEKLSLEKGYTITQAQCQEIANYINAKMSYLWEATESQEKENNE